MSAKIRSYIKYISICFLAMISLTLTGQSVIPNPSLEDEPADATTPFGWYPCEPYTTPDIFPGFWGVYNDPSDGDTFVGLITREDGSHESITARLDSTLLPDVCYQMSLDLAHSKTYAGFNKSLSLRVWIGSEKCEKEQMIFHSPLIEHKDWKDYFIKFTPKAEVNYILIEAFHHEERRAHKGNILIDNISSILPCHRV